MHPLQIVLGLILGPLVGFAAWHAGALSPSGALAAAAVGAAVYGGGGPAWAAGLLLFFVSSSLLSRLFAARKKAAEENYAKGARRDWAQVAANGGLGAALAVVHLLDPAAVWPWPAFLGAMAAANADTWATELGALNRSAPRLITSWRPVEAGTSGAISFLGTLASAAGAALIAILSPLGATALFGPGAVLTAGLAVAAGGMAGSLFDSFLGATVQSIYYCPLHEKETEQHPVHNCGTPTRHLRGLRWVGNDLVNLAATCMGAGIAGLAAALLAN